jgi:hypothetical protein
LGWGSARKAFFAQFKIVASTVSHNKALQHRSASLHWTAFKSHFCGFAAQKYSTKTQLKSCR